MVSSDIKKRLWYCPEPLLASWTCSDISSPRNEAEVQSGFLCPGSTQWLCQRLGELGSSYSPLPLSGKAQHTLSHLMGMRVRVWVNERSSAGQCLSLCQAQSCNCAVYKACPANKDGLSLGRRRTVTRLFCGTWEPWEVRLFSSLLCRLVLSPG